MTTDWPRRRAVKLLTLGAAAVVAVLFGPASAELEPVCKPSFDGRIVFDPCPSGERELALPLPIEPLRLVFLRVDVPGTSFWCDATRKHQFGGGAGDDGFARPQELEIAGAFLDDATASWYYYLGKYELTVAQAAAILSGDDASFNRGLNALRSWVAEGKGPFVAEMVEELRTLSGALGGTRNPDFDRLHQRQLGILARPVRGLSWWQTQELVDRVNRQCFASERCLEALERSASLENVPGFVRLPTELEWEYAARGGGQASEIDGFATPLPFAREDYAEHAVLSEFPAWKGVTSIGFGRRATAGGFYDLLGNVQEITAGLFTTFIGEGKAGGAPSRGGGFYAKPSSLNLATRSEFPFYDWGDETAPSFRGHNHDPFTGIRLAIGSVAKPSSTFVAKMEERFATECHTAEGAPLLKSIETIEPTVPASVRTSLDRLRRDIEVRDRTLRTRTDQLCRTMVENAVIVARTALEQAQSVASAEDRMKLAKEGSSSGSSDAAYWERRLKQDKERRAKGLADLALLVPRYRDTIEVLAEFSGDCVDRGFDDVALLIEDRRRDDGLLALAQQAAVGHVTAAGRGRSSVEQLEKAFLGLGQRSYRARLGR